MDGTLLNSEGLSSEATDFGVHSITGRHLTEEENRSLTGKPVKKVLQEWFPDKSDSIYEAGIGYYRSRMGEISSYPGINKLLDNLRSKYKMAIVTSTHREQAMEILSKVGLLEYFSFIIGQDDTMMNKPDPEPVLLAMNRLGVTREDCIFVGDQPYDIIAAHEAGIIAAAATWGTGMKDVLEVYRPDYFLEHPGDLLELLRTLR